MKNLKLKNGSYISTNCLNRYQLNGSQTDAPDGLHILKDGTELTIEDGRVTKSISKTWDRLQIEDVSPIKKKMAEIKAPASKTKMPDPLKTYSSQEALDYQRKKAADEKLKTYHRLKRARAEGITSKPDRIRFR